MAVNTFLEGRQRYQVTAPVVVCELVNGSEVYLYRDAPLPTTVVKWQIDMFLEQGTIKEIK